MHSSSAILFFFSGNLYLEVFDHQVHTEMNTFARLDSSNGSATSFEFTHCSRNTRSMATKNYPSKKNLLETLVFFTCLDFLQTRKEKLNYKKTPQQKS